MKNQTNHLQLTSAAQEDEEASRSPSHHALRPAVSAAVTLNAFLSQGQHSDLAGLLTELESQTAAIWDGNLGRPEALLINQAHALDGIFNTLAQRAGAAMKRGNLPGMEAYLKMAMRAQSQCRTTIEALGELKAPKSTTFVRQQNVASQQQINHGLTVNGATSHPLGREKEVKSSSNKLNKLISGAKHATVDTGETRSASGIDSQIEDMGTLHRSSNGARKSRSG